MSYVKQVWQNDVTDVDATNMNYIEDGIEKAYGVVLLAVVDTAPSECSVGDKYFNTTTNKIYEANATDTWDTEEYDAESGVFYVVFSERAIYTYNGTTLVGVGSSGAGGENIPVGSILAFAGSNAPEGYLMCDGSNVSRTANNDLFNVIGTTYGQGDGSTTFGLPNIKGKVLVMLDTTQTEFDTLGETGGSKTDDLSNAYAKIGARAEGYMTYTEVGGKPSYTTNYMLVGSRGQESDLPQTFATELGGTTSTIQPYIVVNYIIKAKNTTPTMASVVDDYSTSTQDAYSCNYVNEAIEGTILYNNSSGTTGDITLSDNISNYSYLELVTKNTDGATETFGNYKFDTSFSIFTLMGNSITSNSFAIFTKSYTKGTNKLTTSIGKLYSGGNVTNYDVFKIIKVIGYK